MIVYHYTTEESYNEIQRTKIIRPSDPWTTMDAAHGNGWYFTDLEPQTCDMGVAYHCWRNTSTNVLEKAEYYLKFDINSQILINCREHVYMIQKWDENLIKYLGGGKNKDCGLKPCLTCKKGEKYKR